MGHTTKTAYEVQNSVGQDFVEQHLKGRPVPHGIIEGVINSIFADATSVEITTNGKELTILDNGHGLIGTGQYSNKNGILRPGDSPGKYSDNKKSGKGNKGTGIKTLYVNCQEIDLLSSVADEQPRGAVYSISFSHAEYFASLKTGAKPLVYEVEPLTTQSWPYINKFRTGLCLRVLLKNKLPYTPTRLAKGLMARLLSKYRDLGIVLVNGERLPERVLIGDYAQFDDPHETLGHITAEFYNAHPDDKVSEDELRVGGRVVAEGPFKAFFRILDDNLKKLIPLLFRNTDEICGSIIIPFFEDYSNTDRETFSSVRELPDGKIMRLSDDPRALTFIEWLQDIEPEVRETLKITLSKKGDSETSEKVVSELRDMINSATGGPVVMKRKGPKKDLEDLPVPKPPKPPQKVVALSLTPDRGEDGEYEMGEQVIIRARIRRDLQDTYSRKDIKFHTYQTNCGNIVETDDGLSMVANKYGQAKLDAELVGSSHRPGFTRYSVVRIREFKIAKPAKTIKVGETFRLTCMNTDKAKEPFTWAPSHADVGTLEPDGCEALFTGTAKGEVIIRVVDSSRPSQLSECTITVVEEEEKNPIQNMIKLEDENGEIRHFIYWFRGIPRELSGDKVKSTQPIQMLAGGDGSLEEPYNFSIHQHAYGFEEAEKRGKLLDFLFMAICEEFPYFMHFESAQRDMEYERIPTNAWPSLREALANEGKKLYARILS